MKCGLGICGNCVNDGTGSPSCIKGPVMDNEVVRTLKDFGLYHRDSEGMKVYI
jgi:dihydroorotate dehydrogenase electron transfer subunit